MNIRIAEGSDANQIRKLVLSLSSAYLLSSTEELPVWLSKSLELKEFEYRLKNNEYINTVCLVNEKIIGYISIKNKNHIFHLFVASKHQTKGIAKALWEKTYKTTNESKYTVRSSLSAVPVYESFGFKKISSIVQKDNVKYQEMEVYV